MRTVAQAVKRLLESDNVALEALERGILNLSSYARSIQPQVEEWLWKEVQTSALVIALSRLQKKGPHPLTSPVKIQDMTIQTGVVEFIFEHTQETRNIVSQRHMQMKQRFFVSMQSAEDLTVLVKQSDADAFVHSLKHSTKKRLNGLVAITVQLDDQAIQTPNVFYSLMKPLIAQRINLIEILTGLAEITFVVDEQDQESVLSSLKPFQHLSV